MPLLEIKATKKVTALQVDQYAAFVKCLPDEVVNKALEYTFGKDTEFQKYRQTNPQHTPMLRIKKPAAVASGARRGPKPAVPAKV